MEPHGSIVKESAHNAETHFWSLGQEDSQEEETETHSSILAWRIPWTKKPGWLQRTVSVSASTIRIVTDKNLVHKLISPKNMNLSKLWETVENRGAWHAAVHGVTKNRTRLSDWTTLDKPFMRIFFCYGRNVCVKQHS